MLNRRARGSEFLDTPEANPRLVRRSYEFMRFVNRAGGGIRVVRKFLEREFATSSGGREPVRVLDLGAGDCDIPLAITRWASERGHRVEFTCLDHNATAFEEAREKVAQSDCRTITVEQADMFTYRPASEFDYAMGSMVFHHLTEEDIHRLIEHLRGFVRRAVLINDLHRCLPNYIVCSILTIVIDPEIRHDALLSVRRGFKPAELAGILRRLDPQAAVRRSWFCRVAGVVRFDRKGGK